jgi:hypothetical protein
MADVVFNSVCWGYVHLRHRHGWSPDRAREPLLATALVGLSPRSTQL